MSIWPGSYTPPKKIIWLNLNGESKPLFNDKALKLSSGRGKNKTYKPSSDCKYFCSFNLKSASKVTANSSSTNRPIKRPICSQIYWSYNMRNHFRNNHPNVEEQVFVTVKERDEILKNSK